MPVGKGTSSVECGFSPPDRPAAGASSRRLQYPSKNRVDFGCFSRTSVKSEER
jgi:hypothetical protein